MSARAIMSSARAIYYEVYPGNSARYFPNFATCIFVKPDLYKQWKDDKSAVKFEDILVDSKNPVKYIWTNFNGKKGYAEKVPEDEVRFWYRTLDPMEIAQETALKGYDCTDRLESMTKA